MFSSSVIKINSLECRMDYYVYLAAKGAAVFGGYGST
jgi:hypothetical protein